MKKGFTLIELLAVIVILAIIALITTPIVLNIIEETRENANLRSAEMYLDAVEMSIAKKAMTGGIPNGSYNVLEDGNICLEYKDGVCDKELTVEVKGEAPSSGTIVIVDGTIKDLVLTVGDKIVSKKDKEELVYLKSTPLDCFEYEEQDNTISIAYYTCGGEEGTHKDVVIPREINGKLVTTIFSSAFAYNQLTSVVFPNTLTYIGDGAFEHNQLTSVIIPNSETYIGFYTFASNQLTSVVIPNSVTYIGDNAFQNNQLTSVIIPDKVTTIGDNAFQNNKLRSIVIPNEVRTIGYEAFGSNQLTSVMIKGKSSIDDFDNFGGDDPISVFGWASGYSDANIIWQP